MGTTDTGNFEQTSAERSGVLFSGPIQPNRRILLVDDNENIHEDFRRVLDPRMVGDEELTVLTQALFGDRPPAAVEAAQGYELDSAFQGQEALAKVETALATNKPYALAFVDVRMPPGWDGVKTTTELLRTDPHMSVVICSAYSDHSFEDMAKAFGDTDRVLILKKPFDTIEVRQLAHALQRRWQLSKQAELKVDELESLVDRKTRTLEQANEALRAEAAARNRAEAELRLKQKLESVGQLAAGLAHEINTPMQYILDNLTFLRDAYGDLRTLLDAYRKAVVAIDGELGQTTLAAEIQGVERAIKLEQLAEDLTRAFEETFDGVRRVTEIVVSMKEFALADENDKTLHDLNKIIRNTLTVARNEYKYVAEVETDLGELPPVSCHGGDVGQVLLSLVVNAAQAIADAARRGELGKIVVTSRADGDGVLISITDNGVGIADEIRDRIFDPFFTTKEVGRGRGQGLTIARTVVDKHGGELTFDSRVGEGTTFYLRLPAGDSSAELPRVPVPDTRGV
ncbi:MAG TPA: ATP-binding protein [Gammaproteobacteria bacterium]|nr:ATP-binding protein [Gammaproteobacteria bacterium]